MLSYAKSATARPGDRLNGFENSKTQLFNSWGGGKWAYFQKKWSVPLKVYIVKCKALSYMMAFRTEIYIRMAAAVSAL